MRSIKWIVTVLSLLALLIIDRGFASEKKPVTIRLDAVVVSATRSPMSVFDTPQDVTVLSKEEIMDSPFDRVEDIVRNVPGIYNFRHYGLQTNGIQSPLIMRGVGKNRVLLLVDGVPQNDNFNNAIAWVAWGHIPKEMIERIEIVRGPTSALYGSEGLGGVIHIITKKSRSERQTSVKGYAGSGETYGGSAYHSQKFDNFGLMVAGGYEESDGFYMTDPVESYNIKRHRDVGKVFGKATYDIDSQSDLSLAALYYDHETGKGRQFFYDELQLDQYWMNYSRQTNGLDLKGLVYLNRSDKTAYQDSASDDFTTLNREEKFPSIYTWGADLQASTAAWKQAKLTLGAAFKECSWDYDVDYVGRTRDTGAEGKQRFVSPFANLNLSLLDDNLILNLGARYDWIQTSEGANHDTQASAGRPAYNNRYDTNREQNFSPKLGIAWHPDDKTTVRASGGKGFRAPSLFELYKVQIRGGGTSYREANPNLKPERIWSYDVGAERFLLDKLWGKVSFYQSFAQDYIGDRLTGTGTFGGGKTRFEYISDNISEVDIYGFEVETQWYPIDRISLSANYTYNISKIDKYETAETLQGNYLPNDPRHSFHFGIRYQDPNILNISVFTNYYAKIYYDNENTLETADYWTVDLAVSRQIFDTITLFGNVENIFDEEYPVFRSVSQNDTVAPGAVLTAGVKFDF